MKLFFIIGTIALLTFHAPLKAQTELTVLFSMISDLEKDKLQQESIYKVNLATYEKESKVLESLAQDLLVKVDTPQYEQLKIMYDMKKDDVSLFKGYADKAKENIGHINDKISSLQVFIDRPELLSCSPQIHDVDLEQEFISDNSSIRGVYYGKPTEMQTLGTCYANTSRNLLISFNQGGAVDPSYFDLAVLYKKGTKDFYNTGLDGGFVCDVINQVKEKNYCPQSLVSAEMGKDTLITQGLKDSVKKDPAENQAIITRLFIPVSRSRLLLSRSTSSTDVKILNSMRAIAEVMRKNNILSLPLIKYQMVPRWKIQESLNILSNTYRLVSIDRVLSEFDNLYVQFLPTYLNMILQNASLDEIFDQYKTTFMAFYSKNHMNTPDSWKYHLIAAKAPSHDEFLDPQLRLELKSRLAQLNDLLKKEEILNNEDDVTSSGASIFTLIALADLLDKYEGPLEPFFQEGKLLSDSDLMNALVSPACAQEENRVKVDTAMTCTVYDKYVTEAKRQGGDKMMSLMRTKILLQLRTGHAMGRDVPNHVHTIVGYRYNPETSRCEIKIRETMTAKSQWWDERSTYMNTSDLIELR